MLHAMWLGEITIRHRHSKIVNEEWRSQFFDELFSQYFTVPWREHCSNWNGTESGTEWPKTAQ
jgi:hypothetical protein